MDINCPSISQYSNPKEYPLIKCLSKYAYKETPRGDEISTPDPALMEYKRLSEEYKYFMSIDDIMCVYL